MKISVQQYPSGIWEVYTRTQHIDDTFTSYQETFKHIDDINLSDFRMRAQTAITKARTTAIRGTQ